MKELWWALTVFTQTTGREKGRWGMVKPSLGDVVTLAPFKKKIDVHVEDWLWGAQTAVSIPPVGRGMRPALRVLVTWCSLSFILKRLCASLDEPPAHSLAMEVNQTAISFLL